MKCEGKIGCHACLNLLQTLEERLKAQEEIELRAKEEREKTMKLIRIFQGGS
jgi:hypothetical protein